MTVTPKGAVLGVLRDGEDAGQLCYRSEVSRAWVQVSGLDQRLEDLALMPDGAVLGLKADGAIETLTLFTGTLVSDDLVVRISGTRSMSCWTG